MAEMLKGLVPHEFWRWFAEISNIQMGTFDEYDIVYFLVDFARERGLEFTQDSTKNILMKKASQNSSSKQTILLQSHIDMVCVKRDDKVFDFRKDHIELIVDGDWLRARGTTLGADSAVGVAMMLAILDDKEISHPNLECLFSVEEGVAAGAKHLELQISSTHMINLDSQSFASLNIGYAGSTSYTMSSSYEEVALPHSTRAFEVKIKNLSSGHSAKAIDKNKANGIKLITRFLWLLDREGMGVASISCTGARNVISNNGSAVFIVAIDDVKRFEILTTKLVADILIEYEISEPSMTMKIIETELPSKMISKPDVRKMILALQSVVNGVYKINQHTAGLEASSNIGEFIAKDARAKLVSMQCSSSSSVLNDISASFRAPFELAGFCVDSIGGNEVWRPKVSSEFSALAAATYAEILSREPSIQVAHAGLEPAFIDPEDKMEIISVGMEVVDGYSLSERLQISTAKPFRDFLYLLLSKL